MSQKDWQSFIFWRASYLFCWENLQLSIVWVFVPAVLSGTKINYIVYSQQSIFSTVLYIFLTLEFEAIQFYQRTSSVFKNTVTVKEISYRSRCILRGTSIITKWEQPLEGAIFRRKIFFKIASCPEQLLLSNNYSLVTNTFSDQLLLEDKYFFGAATVSEELFLQNK